MKIKAFVGAIALSTLLMSGAAFAQDAPSGPGTMAPIPNPPEAPKAAHHAKHAKKHAKAHHAAKKASTDAAAAPAQ